MKETPIRAPYEAVDVAPVKLNRRQEAKLRTRQKVLDAARRLFGERGYDAATIRDIAREAGMSTGAVFANFTDKIDLFEAVFEEDAESLAEAMREAAAAPGEVSARLIALFGAGYERSFANLPMVRAVVVRSWLQSGEEEGRMRAQNRGLLAIVADVIRDGVRAGELKADLDVRLAAETLWDAYLRNYRKALFEGADLAALKGRLAAQVALLLDGARA